MLNQKILFKKTTNKFFLIAFDCACVYLDGHYSFNGILLLAGINIGQR